MDEVHAFPDDDISELTIEVAHPNAEHGRDEGVIMEGVKFSVYSRRARFRVGLCLFLTSDVEEPDLELQMVPQLDGVWTLFVGNLPRFASYGYRVDTDTEINADPYARLLDSPRRWGAKPTSCV